MANETRPRREPTSTSRIRKTVAPSAPPAADDPIGTAPGAAASYSKASEPSPGTERKTSATVRTASPIVKKAQRIASRSGLSASATREPVREPVAEREPGMSVRERLARDRAERDGGPIHHEGIPMARDRDRDGRAACAGAVCANTIAVAPVRVRPNFRERSEREASYTAPVSASTRRPRLWHARSR